MSVRQVIVANWPLKIISLLFGILIYIVIHQLIEEENEVEVPVRAYLDPEYARIFHVEHRVRRVKAVMRGPRPLIEDLKNQGQTISLNLDSEIEGGVRAGTYSVELKHSHLFNIPPQVQVSFFPSSIEMKIIQVSEKRVRVSPILELETDLECSLRYVAPRQVTIRGPEDVLNNIQEIPTRPIRERVDYKSQNELAAELVTEINGVAVSPAPSSVKVVLDVRHKQEEYRLKGIPLDILRKTSDQSKIFLEKQSVDLIIKGPPRISDRPLKDIGAESFMAFVDVRNLPETERGDLPLRKVIVYSIYGDDIEIIAEPSDVGVRVESR